MVWKFFSGEKQYPVSNSRRHPRLKTSYLMRYFAVAGAEQEEIKTANTKDISLSGLRFVTHDILKKGEMLRVHVLIPVLGDFVAAFARVENAEKTAGSRLYTVSLSFVEMSRKDHERLARFIAECEEADAGGRLFDQPEIARRKIKA